MLIDNLFPEVIMFEWDKGNRDKNWQKHQVLNQEIEEVFFNKPLIIMDDQKHSDVELRYYCLGQTNAGRPLFISFTIRNNKIRAISARDQDRQERRVYEKKS